MCRSNSTPPIEFALPPERDRDANTLVPLMYARLRELAAAHLKRESKGHSFQATALAHEVYLKLAEQTRVAWTGQAHLMAVAAALVRRVLVDHARAKATLKRGAGRERVTCSGVESPPTESGFDVLDLNDALTGLHALSERQAKVVEMKFFAGLANHEIADALGVSETLVKNEWRFARGWLAARLEAYQS
jgi:RNA polymerase sigma factor (TIGR02999 family)